ncbi:hypothetical protein [Chitinophaga barathri]|uniref:Lipoprotein n=1 Tax=Chitinophaga barathri TaxID=1647451 RepID=A0A3N4MCI8_9BACT|nr:hypothetical protein [Chitinophaga barathri]RPD41105.1 hypothetical protein EG028_10485 [Chitinophaga barathri]
MHRLIPVICGSLFLFACTPKMEAPALVSYEMVMGYRFYTPCGQPVLNGALPAAGAASRPGDFYVYVLRDSLQVADCIDPTGASVTDTFPMRFGNDFILTVVVKDPRREWYFSLEDFSVEDSLLHLRIVPRHLSDTAGGKPWYPLADNYIWRVNGREVKLMKIYLDRHDYALVRGPRWSAAPVKWRRRGNGSEGKTAGD